MTNPNQNQPLRPAQYAEKTLVTAILDGTYPTGTALPNERTLAEQIGVTRPTLRELLQRLAAEGWIRIHHGKPTMVNDYWQEGGLRLLSTLARYGGHLSNEFITHLLEVRVAMLPTLAGRAASHHPKTILDYLQTARNLGEDAEAFADFDWGLQMLMAKNSKNPVFGMILNDFAKVFKTMALRYFGLGSARQASRFYYLELSQAIEQSVEKVAVVVKKAMEQSIDIWHELKQE
jgi:GntR family transcriptional regulator, negative regulator for fad regulon and positive regulator of fabA